MPTLMMLWLNKYTEAFNGRTIVYIFNMLEHWGIEEIMVQLKDNSLLSETFI